MHNWIQFIKERFSPSQYFFLISTFVLSNMLFVNNSYLSYDFIFCFFKLFVLFSMFFFRMRLFDEIKDYALDKIINPSRPLPRNLLTINNVKISIMILIIVELIIAGTFGWKGLLVYIFPVFYSLLMYEEFFISEYLRPHLTTYAITHTIVVVFMGSVMMFLYSRGIYNRSPITTFNFLLSHWFIFNLFEFARKTFDKGEERDKVDSYSKVFGLKGAYLLSWSQVLLSVTMLYFTFNISSWYIFALIGIIYSLVIILLLLEVIKSARTFRLISTIYLAIYFIIMVGVQC